MKMKNMANRVERIHNYEKTPKLCKFCNEPLPYELHNKKDFCNTSCAASFNNRKRQENGCRSPLYKPRYCPVCGKETPARHNIFCEPNGRCDAIYTMTKQWENNIIPTRASVRHYLIKTRGYQCESCGLTEWKGQPVPLESHHKDGNYKNNEEENLELLCPNCHSITDNYRGKNRNKGRGEYKRRQ